MHGSEDLAYTDLHPPVTRLGSSIRGGLNWLAFTAPGHLDTQGGDARPLDEGPDHFRSLDGQLIVVPLTILDFLCIHPFSDGNGRVGRLLSLMLLYQFGYVVGRYISLERVIEDSRETYYDALEASSTRWQESDHNPLPWMTYFWGVLLRAYAEFEERVGEIRTARGAKTQQIRDAIGRKLGPFAISELESDCPGISRDMVRVVLEQMREEGAIELRGRGRGAKWARLG